MPQFESFSLTWPNGSTHEFGARSPAGASEPARWASSDIVEGVVNRLGETKLSFRIKRNSADTADQIQLNMVFPKQCAESSTTCRTAVVDKAMLNIYAVIPDSFSDTDRYRVAQTIISILTSNNFSTAIETGSNYY